MVWHGRIEPSSFTRRCCRRRRRLDVVSDPVKKCGPVGLFGMTAGVLSPCQVTADQLIHRRHRIGERIAWSAQILLAQKFVYRPRQNGGHETARSIHPLRISGLDTVADEYRPRSTQGDQLMGIDGKICSSPGTA